MNSAEYLRRLEANLAAMEAGERDSALRFYQEYIEDAGEENFERVIAKLGPPELLAKQLLADFTERGPGPRRRWSPWMIALFVLASPLLVGLIGGGAGLVVGLIAAAASIMLAISLVALVPFIVAGALCLGGAAMGLAGFTLLLRDTATMLVFVGGGLSMFCLGALAIMPCLRLVPQAYHRMAGMGRYLAFRAAQFRHAVSKSIGRVQGRDPV